MEKDKDSYNLEEALDEYITEFPDKEIRIINAAINSFAEKGFEATRTKEIAQQAGIAEGTIFRYFKTKDAILERMVPLLIRVIQPKLEKPIQAIIDENRSAPVDRIFTEIMFDRLKIINANARFIKSVLPELVHRAPLLNQLKQSIVPLAQTYITQVLANAKERGEIHSDIDPGIIMYQMLGFVLAYSMFSGRNSEQEMRRDIEKFFKIYNGRMEEVMHTIEANGLYKQFGEEKVLQGIDLGMERGEVLGVLGPSGSGKTTLVKCLIGIQRLDSGSVAINSTKIPNLKLMDRIGYMAQQDALYEDLTGLQNLIFYGRLKGMGKSEARKKANELMELVELGSDKNKKVVNYSGGMKRRLSLTAALIGDPEVIVLDEPTVGIDPALRELFWMEFNRLKANGKSIIVTTHVMDEAEKCDRLILLRGGKIIEDGKPEELKKRTAAGTLEAIFIESAKSGGGSIQ